MKHYETHFKLPQTTFQINVVQDVNEGMGLQGQASNAVELSDDMISSSSTDPDVDSSAAVSVTVDMTEDTSTEQPLSPDISDDPVTVMIVEDDEGKSTSSDPGLLSKTREEDLEEKNVFLEKLVTEFKQQLECLKKRKADNENMLQNEICLLRRQLELKNLELEQLRRREKELLAQKVPLLNGNLPKLLKTLQSQHTELLQQHILQARNEAVQCALKELQVIGYTW